jgi:hypothetical protein
VTQTQKPPANPGRFRAFGLELVESAVQETSATPDTAFLDLVRRGVHPRLQHEALLMETSDLSLHFDEPLEAIAP